jgi:outer membrane protein assembly factor BamD
MSPRSLFLLLPCMVLLAACSEFNKAVKSTDKGYKMATAVKYFDKGDYDRAMPLLEELRQITRGDTMYERVSYYYSKGYYGMKDYIMAGYYLDNFAKTFRNSKYAEECSFLAAICHYKESPEFELDQTDTKAAISQLELFMVRYPETTLKDSCNTLIDQLRDKLELKEYEGAKQYLHTRNYRPASIALRNFMKHWPNSPYREDVLFSILEADHDLAVNSVESSQPARIEDGIRSYGTFADAFPESSRMTEAKRLLADLNARKERLSKETKTP